MKQRIRVDDAMIKRLREEVLMQTDTLIGQGGLRQIAEAALGDLLERRKDGDRQGLQGAPCGANKEPPAADHSADEWAYALRSKGEDGAAPAKPAAVEAIDYAHRRDGDTWGGRGHRRGAGGLRIPLPNGHSGHFRVGEACVHTHRRASDRNASGGTDPSSLPSHQDATRDNARPCKHYWVSNLNNGGKFECYHCGVPQPSQASTRPSASTTAAPEVSSAMLYRGVEAWQTSEMWNLDERVSMVFRAMYLKMLE